ncbi:hypothetical protein JQ625_10920 [Bradyrhizobium diazoefficiens]|nr:hypothetical protein [Bradyrhizobium diazoefficiens]MBR0775343.1 hypothetical protein [Bradyrhizobium diazoefficiens]
MSSVLFRVRARFLKQSRIGTEKPGLVRDGSYISVCDAGVLEIARFPLASPLVH